MHFFTSGGVQYCLKSILSESHNRYDPTHTSSLVKTWTFF